MGLNRMMMMKNGEVKTKQESTFGDIMVTAVDKGEQVPA